MNLTPAEKVGLGVVAVGAVVGLVMLTSKPAAAAAPVAGSGPAAAQQYYLFSLTTPYSSNDPTGQAYANVTAALQAQGFTMLQVQEDPTLANGWVGTGLWSGAGTPPATGSTYAAASGTLTYTGAAALGTGVIPPAPMQYPGLVAGNWYTFSVRTIFYNAAPATAAAGTVEVGTTPEVAALLGSMGFAGPTALITASAGNDQQWNCAAQFVGVTPPGSTTPGTSTQDAPPLIVIVPPGPQSVGTSTPAQPSA